jgi:uncharacterized repeat protein (TIGR01451 family)
LADLGISGLVAPDPVGVGREMVYTLWAGNAGPDPALSVELTSDLASGVTFLSASAPVGWICAHHAGVVTCQAASLGAGIEDSISIRILAPQQAGPVVNTLTISSATAEANYNDNVVNISSSVQYYCYIPIVIKSLP